MVTANEVGVLHTLHMRRVYTSSEAGPDACAVIAVTLGTWDSDGAEEEDENLAPIRPEDSMGLRLHLVQEEREI